MPRRAASEEGAGLSRPFFLFTVLHKQKKAPQGAAQMKR
ncbi:hypothetical protein HMPREF1153_1451 [Selenomonas sp. CM52]|nr:hypothetical protein HMPREF1153_1451 [Selenomonas sp. CM52]